jgi:hypothetical protein
MSGQKSAYKGSASEEQFAYAVNWFANKNFEFPMSMEDKYHLSLQPGVYKQQVKRDVDLNTIAKDMNGTALEVMEFIKNYHGSVLGATRCGGDILNGAIKLTGKKTSADVILDVDNNSQIGVSLKYSAPNSSVDNTIKLYTPTSSTLAKVVEDFFEEAFGEKIYVDCKVEELRTRAAEKAKELYGEWHDVLVDYFGINEGRDLPGCSTRAYYRPDSNTPLNSGCMSYIRRLKEAADPQAITFYNELTNINHKLKVDVTSLYWAPIDTLFAECEKSLRAQFLKKMLNLPDKNDPTYLDTLLVSTVRKPNSYAYVEVFDTVAAVDRYLDRTDKIQVSMPVGTTTFRFGPATFTCDFRPGTREGGINIDINKKWLRE